MCSTIKTTLLGWSGFSWHVTEEKPLLCQFESLESVLQDNDVVWVPHVGSAPLWDTSNIKAKISPIYLSFQEFLSLLHVSKLWL